MLHLLRTWVVLMIFEEKNHFFKNFLFKWSGCIFWSGVMHANIGKP
jgi:hypothetical protein